MANCADQKVKTCPSGFSQCMSSVSVSSVGDNSMMKGKSCAVDCHSGSINTGYINTLSVCCDTDGCNVQDVPDPRSIASNGKTCYSCDEQSCLNIMSCSGPEDRCITATGTSKDKLRVAKGCASKSICDATTTTVSKVEGISCCEGNLCNGAQSVTQSFLFLCCSLLSYFMMH
ncbi:hypothetical protein PO909_007688 [Leuciscus waleckii]